VGGEERIGRPVGVDILVDLTARVLVVAEFVAVERVGQADRRRIRIVGRDAGTDALVKEVFDESLLGAGDDVGGDGVETGGVAEQRAIRLSPTRSARVVAR
jgi:hypothetical protein